MRFLKDNCETVEEVGYMKQFSPDQIVAMKDDLSEVAIQINDIETEKKEAMKEYTDRLKPLNDQKSELLGNIKKKAEYVNEQCYKFVDHEDRMVGYYNAEGVLVSSRPARPDEAQMTIRMLTGTND